MVTFFENELSAKKRNQRRGFLFILSSPSGAGKSTLSRLLLKDGKLELSISMTTRQKRPSEVDGLHYHFISKKEFKRKRDGNEFIEWAEVHGNYYGTLRESVENVLSTGRDMLFDIDYQGTKQLQKKMPGDTVSVFILPPSMKELISRLYRRAEDSQDIINLRLKNARTEMQHWRSYDYVIINENLNQSVSLIKSIYLAETVKRERCFFLEPFINGLIAEKID
ncbi:guanylate kinase [Bartonella henselae]|uniref:Guanylate kinase n=2 Tax=Bartonella henselae (strain ATCC 49882 / DSM 28221 / CCUG 30454 / Houston 1) TaxID=283166 RepID=KGUA_BARHE|nr:RecName: Full=Guanylate kinase; AltName: Full=GMP kinase [Bartonella henselae str. Houston-1]ATP12145.1 guanylate kinase [Bartonella henselae]ETS09901.1 guanylate kinase [Bartonella henselae JK 50]ETS10411.1 guanylate kinase [Bartonella henselae JK 51]OLL39795.1 guanylate kinase [Bartonella henselae]OLL40025.1 guanylate kinase [Bartonella henselae]